MNFYNKFIDRSTALYDTLQFCENDSTIKLFTSFYAFTRIDFQSSTLNFCRNFYLFFFFELSFDSQLLTLTSHCLVTVELVFKHHAVKSFANDDRSRQIDANVLFVLLR